MTLMLLAIQVAAIPSGAVPAPPPILSSVPVSTAMRPIEHQAPLQMTDIDLVIRSPSGILWQGTLRVADRGAESNWSQTRSEPPQAECPSRSYNWGSEREMLSLSLSPTPRDTLGSLMVHVRWARRGPGACEGLRTVELRQPVVLTDRQTTTLSADGGLRVELRRRERTSPRDEAGELQSFNAAAASYNSVTVGEPVNQRQL